MCWVNKCCFCIPLENACALIGIGSLAVSTLMVVLSTVFLILEEEFKDKFNLEMKEISINIILWIILFLNLLWMVASVLLLVGMRTNNPSLVLSYFGFGTMTTILLLLSAILELLESYRIVPIIEIIATLIFVHFLVTVHTVYELMLKGKHFGLNHHRRLDEESLTDTIN